MNIPNLTPAKATTSYLYEYLLEAEDDCNAFPDAPRSATGLYNSFFAQGRETHAGSTRDLTD